MKIYTKTGDAGQTGLPGGGRVAKDAAVTEVCGSVDELNTAIGLARANGVPDDVDTLLDRVQSKLFDLGAEVARMGAECSSLPRIDAADVRGLEEAIDRFDADLPPLRNFILPGGTTAAAALHFARAVCRRAERHLVGLMRQCPAISAEILVYLNRLSDLLFVLARLVNLRAGRAETIWSR
jgi:cob(I)alamin adenosyltransferase